MELFFNTLLNKHKNQKANLKTNNQTKNMKTKKYAQCGKSMRKYHY